MRRSLATLFISMIATLGVLAASGVQIRLLGCASPDPASSDSEAPDIASVCTESAKGNAPNYPESPIDGARVPQQVAVADANTSVLPSKNAPADPVVNASPVSVIETSAPFALSPICRWVAIRDPQSFNRGFELACSAPASLPAAAASADAAALQQVSRAVASSQTDSPKPNPAQETLPKPELETLPKPKPVRNALVEPPPAGVVSSALFGDIALPASSGGFSAEADCVLWFIPNRRTSNQIAVPDAIGGSASGLGDTLNDEHLNRHIVAGARVALGYWWTSDNPWVPGGKLPTLGIETRFMFVGARSVDFADERSSTLVRPFFDLNSGKQSGVVIATPGLATGVLAGTASQRLWGAEANVWSNVYYDWPGTTRSVEGMLGLRYLDLNQGIGLARTSSFAANPVGFPDFAFLAGNRITEQESFFAQNRFLGGQVGIRGNLIFENAILTTEFQLAAGNTNEHLNIQGTQVRTLANGQSIVSPGALLALPSNIGRHAHNEFTLIPELGAKVAFPINNHLTLGVSFSTLYWSRIARPADQVDRSVDSAQIPSFPGAGAAMPLGFGRAAVPFTQSDLWLMGITLSAEFRW